MSDRNGGAVGVTDDKWAEQQHGTEEGDQKTYEAACATATDLMDDPDSKE